MKHLRVLEQADLIHVRREGRLRWNVLNGERLQEVPAEYLDRWRPGENDQDDQDDNDKLIEGDAGVRSVEYAVILPASPERIYQAFLHHINIWWPDRNMDGSVLVLEPFVGGRFYESIEDEGAGVLFGFVTCLRPNKEIRFSGPMDAVEEAATSTVRIQFEETAGRTQLFLTHRTAGEVDGSRGSIFVNDWQKRLDQHLRTFVTESLETASG